MVQVFLPYVEVLWKTMPASLPQIKEAGFDGVECHLIGGLRDSARVRVIREATRDLGLKLRFHQGWSQLTGQRNVFNTFLGLLGQLVPNNQLPKEQFKDVGDDPVVVYGNHAVMTPDQPNYLYQTASEHRGTTYARPYTKFATAVLAWSKPVVFDTQHVLEWYFNVQNVEGLPSDADTISSTIVGLWNTLRPRVVEIHLNDFNPKLGASRGRNVYPGTGIFPLKEFVAQVRSSGWSGVVTPEVAPQYLSVDKLKSLREDIDRLFG